MKKSKIEAIDMLAGDGSLSVDFIRNSGLKLRLFAGAPTLLEIGLLTSMYRSSESVVFELFDDDGALTRSYEKRVTVASIIEFLHEKFAQIGIIRSAKDGAISFFDQSNEYFIVLANERQLSETFHLDRDQMVDYLRDGAEAARDTSFFDMLLKRHEGFM